MGALFKIILILFFWSLNITSVIADDSKVIANKSKIKIYVLAESDDGSNIAKSIKVIVENITDKDVAIREVGFSDNAVSLIVTSKDGSSSTTLSTPKYQVYSAGKKETEKYLNIKPGTMFGKTIKLTKEKYIDLDKVKEKKLSVDLYLFIDDDVSYGAISTEIKL